MENKYVTKKLLGVRYMRDQYKQLGDALHENKPMHLKQSNKSCVQHSSMVNENGIDTQH